MAQQAWRTEDNLTLAHPIVRQMARAMFSAWLMVGNQRQAAVDACYDEAGRAPTEGELIVATDLVNGEIRAAR